MSVIINGTLHHLLARLSKVPTLLVDLPFELQTLTLTKLTLHELFRMRITCRSFFNLVQVHASDLTRDLLKHYKGLARAHSLYQDKYDASESTLHYVINLSHHCYVVEALARFIAEYHLTELLGYTSPTRLAQSSDALLVNITITNLKPHLMIIFHALEMYKSSLAELVQDPDLVSSEHALRSRKRVEAWRLEIEILRNYNELQLGNTCMIFDLLKRLLSRQLRPASYATHLERRLRGWTSPKANDEQVLMLMILGGLDAVKRVMVVPAYNNRIKKLEDWTESLIPAASTRSGRLSGAKPNATFPVQGYLSTFNHITAARAMTILPSLASFFNIWELKQLTGLSASSHVRSNRMGRRERYEFLTLLIHRPMNTDFELRREEVHDPLRAPNDGSQQ